MEETGDTGKFEIGQFCYFVSVTIRVTCLRLSVDWVVLNCTISMIDCSVPDLDPHQIER